MECDVEELVEQVREANFIAGDGVRGASGKITLIEGQVKENLIAKGGK